MPAGYTENHSRDVFHKIDLEFYRVINSRCIVWQKKIYKHCIIKKSTIPKTVDDDDNDLPLFKNPNTITNEFPCSQNKEKADVNKLF
jgi:hypothetical protein